MMPFGDEYRQANEALRKLRIQNRWNVRKPFRCATMAEAEQIAILQDERKTPVGVLRENALTGKNKGGA